MAQHGVASDVPWRDRSEARPTLIAVDTSAGGSLRKAWTPSPGAALVLELETPQFLVGLRLSADGRCSFAVEYSNQGGAGEAPSGAGDVWCSVVEHTCAGAASVEEVLWPDVGAHVRWRLRLCGADSPTITVHELLVWRWGVRLDVPSAFPPSGARLADHQRHLLPYLERGEVVLGDTRLLSQLYHESDLLGWGAAIPFPCFMTLWAKPASSRDFAGLVHRFVRRPATRPPLLVLSGTDVAARDRLRALVKPLLRPEYAERVRHIDDPDRVLAALWGAEQRSAAAPPGLAQVNERLAAAQRRLGVAVRGYAPQFVRRDPLMLLLTREAFGAWAPNRVAAEVEGHDIFRTFAKFSVVDGVVCAEETVWLHEPMAFYAPAPDVRRGDKRPKAFLELLEQQRPSIDRLLDEYEARGWIERDFRRGLEGGLLRHREDEDPHRV